MFHALINQYTINLKNGLLLTCFSWGILLKHCRTQSFKNIFGLVGKPGKNPSLSFVAGTIERIVSSYHPQQHMSHIFQKINFFFLFRFTGTQWCRRHKTLFSVDAGITQKTNKSLAFSNTGGGLNCHEFFTENLWNFVDWKPNYHTFVIDWLHWQKFC